MAKKCEGHKNLSHLKLRKNYENFYLPPVPQ